MKRHNVFTTVVIFSSLVFSILACKSAQDAGFVPLDKETLGRLEISLGETGQVKPGQTMELKVGVTECCYVFEEKNPKVSWTIVPPVEGVTIDRRSGTLVVDHDVPAGTRFTVQAEIEDGANTLQTKMWIFTEESNPFVGTWHEATRIGCNGEMILPESGGVRELVFKADGYFSVTYYPFEVYKDYWGSYKYDLEAGKISFAVEAGSVIPDGIDLDGEFKFDKDGQLVLEGIWLGDPEFPTPQCGHVFGSR